MDLQVTQENLQKAVSNVARIASGRASLPILHNILISTESNMLKLSATNLDIALTQSVGTKIKKSGTVTIPARLFQDYINNLPKTAINLKQEGAKLHISTDEQKSTINGMPADEFPVMPDIKDPGEVVISATKLKHALQQVVFAASADEARPVLTGVLVQSIDGNLFIAATDSYRLAEKKLSGIKDDVSLLVPQSAMNDLLRILSDTDGDVTIYYDDQQTRFVLDDAEMVARQIDGQYPDYKKLIPKKFSNKASVSREQLITVTKIAGLFSRESAGSIVVSIQEGENALTVTSVASQVGENTSHVAGKTTGEGDITLNSRYLLDVLQAMTGDEVEFCFNGKLDPIVIRDTSDKDYTHIIMPLKS